ncbi:MAG: DUF1080 domain-containing protein [Saprospiraceae bacterium]|nr:DUF1080 domain-containing protein [Saprospiraceae bacterium]
MRYLILSTTFYLIGLTGIAGQTTWKPLFTENISYSKSGNCTIDQHLEDILIGTEGDGAWISLDEPYHDFMIEGEFLLNGQNTAQLIFRLNDMKSKIPEINGYAVQFDSDPDQQNCLGSIINVSRAVWVDSLNFEHWNSFKVRALGDHLQVFVADQLATETHSRRSIQGGIKIVMNGSGPIFRNLKISRLAENQHLDGPATEDYLQSYPEIEYKKIFDGKTLSGWHSTGSSEWKIVDGSLYGYSGTEGGFLISDESYHNFHLKFKFKIIEEDNSGIFIRRPETAEETSLLNSVECNIYDHNGYTHAYPTGALVRHARSWYHMIDYDDWNTGEIFALNDHIIMYINGRKSSEAHLADYDHPGQICLQAGLQLALPEQGPSEVYFKDIWIKCIDQ